MGFRGPRGVWPPASSSPQPTAAGLGPQSPAPEGRKRGQDLHGGLRCLHSRGSERVRGGREGGRDCTLTPGQTLRLWGIHGNTTQSACRPPCEAGSAGVRAVMYGDAFARMEATRWRGAWRSGRLPHAPGRPAGRVLTDRAHFGEAVEGAAGRGPQRGHHLHRSRRPSRPRGPCHPLPRTPRLERGPRWGDVGLRHTGLCWKLHHTGPREEHASPREPEGAPGAQGPPPLTLSPPTPVPASAPTHRHQEHACPSCQEGGSSAPPQLGVYLRVCVCV